MTTLRILFNFKTYLLKVDILFRMYLQSNIKWLLPSSEFSLYLSTITPFQKWMDNQGVCSQPVYLLPLPVFTYLSCLLVLCPT